MRGKRLLSLFYERKRYVFSSLALTVLFFLLFHYLSSKISVAFTIRGQECFPYRFWLIRKGAIPERGEYVAFKNPRIDGRATWIKVISGIKGDRIEVIRISEKDRRSSPERFRVFVDEIGKELTIQGHVFLQSSGPSRYESPSAPPSVGTGAGWAGIPTYELQVFEAFEKDTKGRGLPMIEEAKIPKGKYFVSSPAVRSYDSRYWGLVDESEIIGKAYPIF